ncbi:LysE family translocator [Aeromonas allosaccharophila]|uniref:LysE family translocator n=1 Tax=Aeromonas allosaccharophila TaxID=656 RepID=UPI0005A80708|nr:LysE family translocator [Aeromonas allosaccharophila]
MTMEWYVTLFGFAVLTCGTPGPNNLMLTASGANFGVRRTLPHLLGVGVGQPVLQLVLALGLYPLFERWPLLRLGLQIFGSLYLLWLAWRIAVAGAPGDPARRARPLTMLEGLGFQFLNPKAWMMGISAISGFTLGGEAYWPSALWVLVIFFITGLYTGAFWVLFGAQVRQIIRTARGWRRFNLGMGLATAACVGMIWI